MAYGLFLPLSITRTRDTRQAWCRCVWMCNNTTPWKWLSKKWLHIEWLLFFPLTTPSWDAENMTAKQRNKEQESTIYDVVCSDIVTNVLIGTTR